MKLIADSEHFDILIMDGILKAKRRVWIATANVKDLHVPGPGRRSRPLLDHLAALQARGVRTRILHGGKPSSFFLNSLNSNGELHGGEDFEMQQCPRVHFKMILVDERLGYCGSANLTGAGLGCRSAAKRNFETGVVFSDPESIERLEEYFDRIWMGEACEGCGLRKNCPQPFV